MENKSILIIDDEAEIRTSVSDILSDEGYRTLQAENEREAFSLMSDSLPDLIFLDLWIGNDESAGLKILEKLKRKYIFVPVIMISGHGSVDSAVKALKQGAFDFIEKPFVIDRLLLTVKRAFEFYDLKTENSVLKNGRLNSDIFAVGKSVFAQSIKALLEKISPTNGRVFIKSKIGIGADSLAFEIHKKSQRKAYPFIVVTCADDEKFEEELFGTEKRYGLIEKANLGTLYLESITKLSANCQNKLLQFLQQSFYFAGNRRSSSDVRVISSTCDNVASSFNQELFCRLNVINIDIPTIKNRKEDILPLIDYYLSNSEAIFGLKPNKISESALAILQAYDWPCNIHQIKNVIESSLIRAKDDAEIGEEILPSEIRSNTKEKFALMDVGKLISLPIREAKECFETDYLKVQIDRFSGNISKTAEFIQMERSALHRKLKTLNVTPKRIRKTKFF
ncbi:MAG: sigma-54 dependent transcriptional regulator [Holosporaceae bacterium]|jgi:two-component system nitrogen regulation response regulator NtrX|nr:sigma-54 dependent transcriptional regulator [Holosporaceae bacterium]